MIDNGLTKFQKKHSDGLALWYSGTISIKKYRLNKVLVIQKEAAISINRFFLNKQFI